MDPLEVSKKQSFKNWRFFVLEFLANQQATVLELSASVAVFELNRTFFWKHLLK